MSRHLLNSDITRAMLRTRVGGCGDSPWEELGARYYAVAHDRYYVVGARLLRVFRRQA